MLKTEIVERIEQLLQEDRLSQRQIARLVGVSRGSVGSIAAGRRPKREAERAEPVVQAGPPKRCPDCGGMVYLPCRLCHARRLVAEGRVRRRRGRPDESPALALREDHEIRRREVLLRRPSAAPPDLEDTP